MSTNFPSNLDALTNPTSTDKVATVDHAAQHANANDAIEALQAKVGVDSSAVTSSLDYIVKNSSSVSPGHKHVLNDNTDVDTTGAQDGDSLKYVASTGKFEPNATSTPDASTTVAGKVEIATDAEVEAGTGTGGSGAKLVVAADSTHLPNDNEMAALAGTSGTPSVSNKYVTNDDVASAATASKIARRNATGDVTVPSTPSAGTDATSKTYVDAKTGHANNVTTYDISTASGTQTIAHGLGVTPNFVRLDSLYRSSGSYRSKSFGSYNGTTNTCIYDYSDNASAFGSGSTTSYAIRVLGATTPASNYQTGVITVDATNITITWTKTGSPTGTAQIRWEAHG